MGPARAKCPGQQPGERRPSFLGTAGRPAETPVQPLNVPRDARGDPQGDGGGLLRGRSMVTASADCAAAGR